MIRASLFSFLLFLLALPAAAQRFDVPRNADAEAIFDEAIDAFEEREYATAYRRFRLVYTQYPLNQKTTAALIMASKALYRQGDTQHARALLQEFVRTYQTSSYLPEARSLLRRIEEGGAAPSGPGRATVELGIALPLTARDAPLTQAFFNGLRMAVDEHNAQSSGPRVRMVFRNTRNEAERARAAMTELRGAAVVIGPLYSEEALAAAAAAERSGVTMIAPLATDPRVSQGRAHVFQANATTEVRGRAMARYAISSMRARTFGIVAEGGDDGLSAQMTEAFEDEVMREGGTIQFYQEVPSRGGWSKLDESLDPEALGAVDALYLPVVGRNADADIRAALTALGRTGATPRVLGNAEWHHRGDATANSRYGVTYTNDFYPDDSRDDVRRFRERYRAQTGDDLGKQPFTQQRLAFTGYDLGRFVLAQVGKPGDLREVLHKAPRYEGLGINLDFRDGNVNTALFINRYRAGQVEVVR